MMMLTVIKIMNTFMSQTVELIMFISCDASSYIFKMYKIRLNINKIRMISMYLISSTESEILFDSIALLLVTNIMIEIAMFRVLNKKSKIPFMDPR